MKLLFLTTITILFGTNALAQIAAEQKTEKKEDAACVVKKQLSEKTRVEKTELTNLQTQYDRSKATNTAKDNLKFSREIGEKQFYLNRDLSEYTFASMSCDFSMGITRFKGNQCPIGLDAIAGSSSSDADSDEVLCQKRDSPLVSNTGSTEHVTKIGEALRVEGPPDKVSIEEYDSGKPQ